MKRSPVAGAHRRTGPSPRLVATLVAAIAGLTVAALAGLAFAKSFTLGVAKDVKVSAKSETVVVGANGKTAYALKPETTRHLLCASKQCLQFWPPLKVAKNAKLTKAPGISGKLGTITRAGFTQVTLNGRPLYNFQGDSGKRQANGQGIKSFGGTWGVITANASGNAPNTTSTSTTTTTSSTTSTSTSSTCLYPPYC